MQIGSSLPSLASQLTGLGGSGTVAPAGSSFSDVFKAAVVNVDDLQSSADTKISEMLQGSSKADVGNITVAVEKADVAFQLMMQVRNKVVSAYQEIEKMQF